MENLIKMKGLTAEILRGSYTSPINVMKDSKKVTIIDEALDGVFEASKEAPAVKIVRRVLCGEEYIHAEPIAEGSYSAGGSFIYTPDSRVRAVSQYPIPLHDRDMSKEI